MKKALLSLTLLFTFSLFAQKPNVGIFTTYAPGYYQNSILKGIEEDNKTVELVSSKSNQIFKVNIEGIKLPTDKNEFKQTWHNSPVSQGNTSTCWSYCATSFVESEIYRQNGIKVKLSEMFTVYWEYVNRAKLWVETRGNIYLGEGSEMNSITKILLSHGAVPYDDYSGLINNRKVQSHEKMANEIFLFLNKVKDLQLWDEKIVVENVKSILNFYMGEPPTKISVNGKSFSPTEYLSSYLKIDPSDFIDIMSLLSKPYWKKCEFTVDDNWWHADNYYNVPLNDFTNAIKNGIKNGYTIAVAGDVSEAGFVAREANAAIVPTFDIPSQFIDENARQFRYSNNTTTDDHGMHIVGWKEIDNVTWYLLKDSGAGSRNGGTDGNKNFGYYFFHEDYVKLKMMTFIAHKDVVKELLSKFK